VTSNGILVLSHDAVTGGRPVGEWHWDELAHLDLGGGHRPLALSDLLAAFPTFPFNLEVKNFPGEPGFDGHFEVAVETARRARPGDLLSCFYWPTMDAVRAGFPQTDTGLLIHLDGDAGMAVDHAVEMGHKAIIPHWQLALRSPEALGKAVASGLRIVVWTLNDPDRLPELASLGVTAIITDDPGLMRRAVTNLQKETT
jgi:glycerophosphoryl diester phosphodiesterase